MKTITAKDLKKKIDAKEDMILIDALSEESFKKEHIPGSINITFDKVTEKAKKFLKDKNQEIITYCEGKDCHASMIVAKKLMSLGYKNVIEFEGGIEGWAKVGYKFERGSK